MRKRNYLPKSNNRKLAKVVKSTEWNYDKISVALQHMYYITSSWLLHKHTVISRVKKPMMLVYDDLNEVIDCTQNDSKESFVDSIVGLTQSNTLVRSLNFANEIVP